MTLEQVIEQALKGLVVDKGLLEDITLAIRSYIVEEVGKLPVHHFEDDEWGEMPMISKADLMKVIGAK